MSLLLVVVVHELDADRVVQGLRAERFGVTRLASTGGFLGTANATLLIGIEDADEGRVLGIIERECTGREIEVPLVMLGNLREGLPRVVKYGGATVFVVELRRMVRLRAEGWPGGVGAPDAP